MITTKAELMALLREESDAAITRELPGVALGLTLARIIIQRDYQPAEPKQPEAKQDGAAGRVCPDCNGKGYRSILLFGGIVGHETCIFCQGLGTQGGKH